jgi:hypothetical protein
MVKEITIEHALHNSRMKLFFKFDYDRETIELEKKWLILNGVIPIKVGI